MFSCLQILEAFLWFVLITLLNVTLIILTLSVSRLLNLLLRLVAFKQLIRNGRSASLQRTFKKSFTSFSHSTRNKTRDGLIRVRNIRALNGRFNTSITHAYSIVIGSK